MMQPHRGKSSYILGALLLCIAASAHAQLQQIRTADGALRPLPEGTVEAYLGIPYAASSAGANRWRAPQPPKSWRGVRDAHAFGSDCQQGPPYDPPGGSPWTKEYFPHGAKSEDCLFLNVWTPAKGANDKLPVMMWIHGGGFAGGSASIPIYRGSALASRGIIVVSINYRVGVFGFLAHPDLIKESGTAGNYGLLDQIAALQWIRRNIAAFGGDPQQVTIAGQSAGAASVHALIASPLAKGLFNRAIAQSGSGMGLNIPALADAAKSGERLAREIGAPSLSALRALSAEKLMAAIDQSPSGKQMRFGLVSDAHVLPNPAATLSEVPVLTGLNADETSVDANDWTAADKGALQSLYTRRFGDQAQQIAAVYAATPGADARTTARTMLRDRGVAAMIQWAQQRPSGSPPVYAYLYNHVEPGSQGARFGAFHSAEIAYVFDTLDQVPRPFLAEDRQIAATLGSYWTNFVKTADPNGAGLPRWPDLRSGQLMELGEHFAPRPALTTEKLKAYQSYVDAGGRLGMF